MRIRPPFVAKYESTVLGLRTSTFFQVALVLLLLLNLSLSYLYKTQIDRTLAAHQDALHTVGAALDARGQHEEAVAVHKKALGLAPTASAQNLPPSAGKTPGEGLGLPTVKGSDASCFSSEAETEENHSSEGNYPTKSCSLPPAQPARLSRQDRSSITQPKRLNEIALCCSGGCVPQAFRG